jgi:hypothetical protein
LSSHRQSTRLSLQQGREIKDGFHGSYTLSDGGLLLALEVDERLESGELIEQYLVEFCGEDRSVPIRPIYCHGFWSVGCKADKNGMQVSQSEGE